MRSKTSARSEWLDSVPDKWSVVPSKAAFVERRQRSKSNDQHLTPSQKLGVLSQEDYMRVTGTKVVLNLSGQENMKHVEPDDFIIHLRSFQGGIERSTVEGKVSMAYTVLTPRSSRVLPSYYRWLLKADAFIQELQSTTDQLRDGQSIKYDTFGKIRLPVPPRDEQRAIADYLDQETAQIDALVAKQEEFIGLLRERRLSKIAEVFAGIGEPNSELRRVARVQTGVTLSGDGDPQQPTWPYLRVANVQMGRVDLEEIKEIHLSPVDANASMLRPGDVLMTEGGDIDKLGRGTVWDGSIDPIVHQNHVFAVRVDRDRVLPEYLAWWLDTAVSRRYFYLTAKKTTNLASTNKTVVGRLPLNVPSLDEQRLVVEQIDEQTSRIDTLIAKAEELIALAKERRSALITAAVTGQIDVRTARKAS